MASEWGDRAEPLDFRLQRLDPPVAFRECRCDIRGLEALWDMLWAIGVPGCHLNQERLFGPRPIALGHELRDQGAVTFDHPSLAPDLHPLAVRIVDQEQVDLGIVGKVALRDILPVAGEVCERDGVLVKYAQETRRSAAMLDIGLAVGVDGREEDAGLCRDELREIGCNAALPATALLHAGIGRP